MIPVRKRTRRSEVRRTYGIEDAADAISAYGRFADQGRQRRNSEVEAADAELRSMEGMVDKRLRKCLSRSK